MMPPSRSTIKFLSVLGLASAARSARNIQKSLSKNKYSLSAWQDNFVATSHIARSLISFAKCDLLGGTAELMNQFVTDAYYQKIIKKLEDGMSEEAKLVNAKIYMRGCCTYNNLVESNLPPEKKQN